MTTTIPNAEHEVTTLKELRNSLGTKINEAARAEDDGYRISLEDYLEKNK